MRTHLEFSFPLARLYELATNPTGDMHRSISALCKQYMPRTPLIKFGDSSSSAKYPHEQELNDVRVEEEELSTLVPFRPRVGLHGPLSAGSALG
jgi:hypothetical protein